MTTTASTLNNTALDVAALREREFAWMNAGKTIYLNAASTGPMPASAVTVADKWTRLRAEPQHIPLTLMQEEVAKSRRQYGQLIGADEGEIALMPNTTYGLNLAARSLPLRPGTILTFDGEFPSCVYPFMALGSHGITLEIVPKRDGLPDEDTLVQKIGRGDVVAVVVSWVQFANGFVADLERIGKACRAAGAFFIVDGIQGCGILPMSIHDLPIDMFASGAQKWQLSPWGTGFVYVRKDLIETIEPHDVGWACMTASSDYNRLTDYEFDFYKDARRFEVITVSYHDFAVSNASTRMLLDLGPAAIQMHITSLIDRVIDWTNSRSDVHVVTPIDAARRAGVFSFKPNDLDAAAARLKKGGVTFATRESAIRLAPHCYNTIEEMDRVIALLDD
ncbi:MAG: aminotransferase class V-fold PLP-dependent enzyme [Gemmatimonadaceae bacterium]